MNPWGRGGRWPGAGGCGLILLAALLSIAPLLVRGPSCGHDFNFHLANWFDVQQSWREGLFYPHWSASANYGAGEPRFVFYPPLSWMLGAFLGLFLPWSAVPAALSFLLLAGSGLATRALARLALPQAPAALAGCLTIFSGYALYTAYERTAYAELAGGIWLPLLLLYALRPAATAGHGRQLLRAAAPGACALALALAGAWLSNAPVGVMASYLLAASALAATLTQRSWLPLLRALLGGAVGLALVSFYLLPAAWERRWVDIRQATDDPGLKLENSWLFARHADPALLAHDLELARVSWIAVAMLAACALALLVLWRRGRLGPDLRWFWPPLALAPLAVLLLLSPISGPVWNLLPELRFLQFPWRWLAALESPMAVLLAWALWPEGLWRRRAVSLLCALLFLAETLLAGASFQQSCDEQDSVAGSVHAYQSGRGFEGSWEYNVPGANLALVAEGLPELCLLDDPGLPLGAKEDAEDEEAPPRWRPEQKGCQAIVPGRGPLEHRVWTLAAARPAYVVLRRRRYPAWELRANGSPLAILPGRADGLIVAPLPAGLTELRLDWRLTPDALAGRLLSLAGLVALLLLSFYGVPRRAVYHESDGHRRKSADS